MGGERLAVPNIHNDVTNGWGEVLISCIKMQKPFRVGIVHDTNGPQWKTWLTQALSAAAMIFPVAKGYSTGGTYSSLAAVTDYVFGGESIQQRVDATMTITPSGEPTITPGTNP